MIHKMKLYDDSYELIKKGVKKIELRLNDEKRKKIKLGDTVLFINTKTQKWLATKVNIIYTCRSFKDLFEQIEDRKLMGFLDESESIDEMVLDMRAYYSEAAENENGVLGIGIERPMVEMDFPVNCKDTEVKYVIIAAFCKDKLVFCKHRNRNTIELPGGHVEQGESILDAAIRELYEETGITDIKSIVPISKYHAKATNYVSNGAYGMLYAVEIENLPEVMPDYEMERIELHDINPYKKGFNWCMPEMPSNLTHFEIYSVILYYIQRMLLNDDLIFGEEEIDYYNRLKYYEEDVCVDYESFDADSYLHYVVMRTDCDDYWSPLQKVSATEENYREIRDELIYSCDLFEFFTLLVEKYGAEKVKNDKKLMDKVCDAFDKESVDIALGV